MLFIIISDNIKTGKKSLFISAVQSFNTLQNRRYNNYSVLRNPCKHPVFCSIIQTAEGAVRKGHSTSAGKPLKSLKNITCPYTGIKMIQSSKIGAFELRLAKCKTPVDYVKLLGGYADFLQPVEKKMYKIFSEYAAKNPEGSLQKCLIGMYNASLTKLKLEEFKVLDKVDRMSNSLTPETALELRKKTTRCREVIIANDSEDTFKRKTFLNSLDEINYKPEEKKLFERIRDQALYLPTSASSPNAFVVKYVNRPQHEIVRRIFLASTTTIEHVTPASKYGQNDIGNFMLTSANGNRYRENMPLTKYIDRFPFIPAFCQKYINEIIQAIHKGALKGNESYPYKIKKKLADESEGRISLNLSKYKYSEQKAEEIENAPRRKKKKKLKTVQYF